MVVTQHSRLASSSMLSQPNNQLPPYLGLGRSQAALGFPRFLFSGQSFPLRVASLWPPPHSTSSRELSRASRLKWAYNPFCPLRNLFCLPHGAVHLLPGWSHSYLLFLHKARLVPEARTFLILLWNFKYLAHSRPLTRVFKVFWLWSHFWSPTQYSSHQFSTRVLLGEQGGVPHILASAPH